MNIINQAEVLIKEYQHSNDKERLEVEIIDLYEKTIGYILRNFEQFNYYEDMKQEVIIALIKAIRTYNVDGDIKFSTYAVNHMRFIVYRKMRYQHLIRIPEYLDLDENRIIVSSNWMKNKMNEDFNVYDMVITEGFSTINYDMNICIMKKFLSKREFEVAYMYYLGYRQADISRELNVSTARIGQIMDSIKKKLKNKYVEVI